MGLGDVALPSLLVSFLGRYGDARGERAWRLTATSAYAVGLLAAFAANEYWRAGQPALLYLVPCTLGAIVAHAARRGELGAVWAGTPLADAGSAGFDGDDGSEGAEYEEHKMLS